ncbi:beta-ribofuranosylaminobenzene 5'-phosphate synthase family protein [Pseudomonas sp. NPDC090201]|uniref:beta-ribofuranosylaminobenzene 5'-phosphate synthase family protein n=1 Tax=Pseudomonas sp. NPDC090201 TaxID=3364475 RepID=UPI003813448F
MRPMTMNNIIKITTPARIHVNLFDMSNTGYRQNGGVGFCINGLDTVIEFSPSQSLQIIDKRPIPYTVEEESRLVSFMRQIYATGHYQRSMKITFISGPPPHSGFGTGTATKLACVEAASIFNKIPCTQAELISTSGRGGTSGVGINTYFKGGLNVDFGVKHAELELGPSSARNAPRQQPINLINVPLPAAWTIGVFVPLSENRISGDDEVKFFKKTCPIAPDSVHGSIYQALSGLACAAIEEDFNTFCSAINATQNYQWKNAEWMAQSVELRELRANLAESGASCVGLSSLGPAIYFMAPTVQNIADRMTLPGNHIFAKCSPNNHGRVVEID